MNLLAALADTLLTGTEDRSKAEALLLAGDGVSRLELARLIGEAGEAADVLAEIDAASAPDATTSVLCLVAACFAAVRADYRARQDAARQRDAIGRRAEAAYALAAVAGPDMLGWLVALVGETVTQLSVTAANRAPLVRVATMLSLPSSLIAWQLYGDPTRAGELVDRNSVATPMVMPAEIEALGPNA